jgi:hypothetical protein
MDFVGLFKSLRVIALKIQRDLEENPALNHIDVEQLAVVQYV